LKRATRRCWRWRPRRSRPMDKLKLFHAIEDYLVTGKGMKTLRAINPMTLPNHVEAWAVDQDGRVQKFDVTEGDLRAYAEKVLAEVSPPPSTPAD
jgi:hypothetical protein